MGRGSCETRKVDVRSEKSSTGREISVNSR